MKKVLITVILSLVFCVGTYAQTDDQCLIALEKTTIDLRRAEAERDSYKEQMRLKDEMIASLEKNMNTLNSIITNLDKQVGKLDKMDATTALIIQNLREEVSAYKAEVVALRKDVDRQRRIGDIKMAAGVVGGFFIGSKRN
jgi:chromosome segregation ATPase